MKKLTLIIAAVATCFVMASCGGASPKESIMKATDEFFTQAENNVQSITSGEEFMNFVADMEIKRDELIQKLFGPYTDKDGNIKGISDTDMEEIQSYIYDRASAYNNVESVKAVGFIEPVVAKYEAAVNAIVDAVATNQPLDNAIEKFEEAENELAVFADYDNVPVELQKRAQAAEAKLQEVLAVLMNE